MQATRILLVDDEVSLLRLMQRYLTRIGYQVDACERATQAWDLFCSPGGSYELVIVDLTLPDLPGDVLLGRMIDRQPGTRAIICSGVPPSTESFSGSAVRPRFLQKPFQPKMLAEAVADALAGTRKVTGTEPV